MTRGLSPKLFILLGLAALLPWISCTGGEEGEYEEIVNSGAQGTELISALEDFEIRHGGHFYSKLDLGIYYLAAGETDRARDYLRRAERILPAPGSLSPGKENSAALLYGALAQVCLMRKDYQGALDYADKAVGADRENRKSYRFLRGHVLIARQEYPAALEAFDALLTGAGGTAEDGAGTAGISAKEAADGDEAEAEELRAYMFLLAQAERSAEAAAALDRYFRTGAFFPGLGWFAAAVYRAAGEMEKAACAVYLEEEYRSGYRELQDPRGFEALAETTPDGEDRGSGDAGKTGAGYFAAEYFELKNLIKGAGNFSKDEFLRLVNLEPYFRLFPSFYWNLWQGARRAYPEDYRYFSTALQKIIALDKDGPFARGAWEELTRLMGY